MTTRRARLLILTGVIGLASMRAAYDLTYEPAPAVRVEWRKDLPDWRRTLLESWYRLGDRQAPHDRSYAYVLFDTRQSNIRSLVRDRFVVGTGDIDRERFEIPWSGWQESDEYTWVADRIPVFRYPSLRQALIATLVVMILIGVRQLRPARAPDTEALPS